MGIAIAASLLLHSIYIIIASSLQSIKTAFIRVSEKTKEFHSLNRVQVPPAPLHTNRKTHRLTGLAGTSTSWLCVSLPVVARSLNSELESTAIDIFHLAEWLLLPSPHCATDTSDPVRLCEFYYDCVKVRLETGRSFISSSCRQHRCQRASL